MNSQPRPYHALSGGERALFNSALCYALEADFVIIEAGEADAENLRGLIGRINSQHPDCQVLLNAWHRPARKPKGWYMEELG